MILVTVGTHDQQFDRLLAGMDELTPALDSDVVAQVGHSGYRPENMEWFDFVSESEITEYYREADIVVGHAGAGTILTALSHEKPLVVMPRRKAHGEHLDDHQLELANELQTRGAIFVVETRDELSSAVEDALAKSGTTTEGSGELVQYFSNELEPMLDR